MKKGPELRSLFQVVIFRTMILKDGMSTTVRILNGAKENSLIIPHKALTEQLGEFFVYVVGDSSKVSQRRVFPGKQIDKNIIIKDGLKEGEIIVVQGTQNLREGAVITTTPATGAKAGGKQ